MLHNLSGYYCCESHLLLENAYYSILDKGGNSWQLKEYVPTCLYNLQN